MEMSVYKEADALSPQRIDLHPYPDWDTLSVLTHAKMAAYADRQV